MTPTKQIGGWRLKTIAVMSTKGGVGKSTICAGIGKAIAAVGYKVGFFDMDWVAPTLHIELGIPEGSKLTLENTVGNRIRPVIAPGNFPLISSAFLFPDDQAIMVDEKDKISDTLEILRSGVVDWGNIDYLMIDTPPSTEKFIQEALTKANLYGVVIVSQPAIASLTDVIRTVSLMRDLQIPVIGLVVNQVYLMWQGHQIDLYDLGEKELREFSERQGLPYLGSIPHILPGQKTDRDLPLQDIAAKVLAVNPVVLKQITTMSLPYRLLLSLVKKKVIIP
jgi:ATP-binding protein involved in chromosome partitioning